MSGGVSLRVEGLSAEAGAFRLRDVTLELAAGCCGVLLGPTGSGKTVLAETICGLRRPAAGRIWLGDRDVTDLDPAARRIGYVPQDYALFPFLTVRENLAFGLRARRMAGAERAARVSDMLEVLGLAGLADRRTRFLSGGERQRVALGRALVVRPEVLLLDEPLSALDEATAGGLRAELARVRKRFGITTLHICHSLEEAVQVGDVLAVMRAGRLVQAGTPDELFRRPTDLGVARFLRLSTVAPGEVRPGADGSRWFWLNGRAAVRTEAAAGPAHGVIDPVRLRVSRTPFGAADGLIAWEAEVRRNPLAPWRADLHLGGGLELVAPGCYPETDWPPGTRVHVGFEPAALWVIPGGS